MPDIIVTGKQLVDLLACRCTQRKQIPENSHFKWQTKGFKIIFTDKYDVLFVYFKIAASVSKEISLFVFLLTQPSSKTLFQQLRSLKYNYYEQYIIIIIIILWGHSRVTLTSWTTGRLIPSNLGSFPHCTTSMLKSSFAIADISSYLNINVKDKILRINLVIFKKNYNGK